MASGKILPEAMLQALQRFGLPAAILEMVAAIYDSRRFCVKEAGVNPVG